MPSRKEGWPVNNHFRLSTGNADYTNVSTKPAVLYGVQAYNNSSVQCFLKLYDISTGISSVTTTGGTVPNWAGLIPGGVSPTTVAIGAGFTAAFPQGLNFRNGLSYSLVTGSSVVSTAGVTAESVLINLNFEGS